MQLELLKGTYTVARLSAEAAIPAWAQASELLSITRTPDELSIICADVPEGVQSERGWRCLKVRGPLDFSLVGIVASIAAPLASAGVPIFVISTFDTDYILVRVANLAQAIAALGGAGHSVLQ